MKVDVRRLIIALICFIDSCITLSWCFSAEGYELLFLFPIVMLVPVLSHTFTELARSYIGIKILYYTMLVKYVLFPFCMALGGEGRSSLLARDLRIATVLIIVELLVVTLIVTYFGQKKLIRNGLIQDFKFESNYDKSHMVEWGVIFLALMFIIIHPDLLNNFSFATFDDSTKTVSYFLGLDTRIIQVALMLIFCLVVLKCKKAFENTGFNLYYIIALFVGVICMLVFKGENRASLLIGIISVSVVLTSAFPIFKKRTITVIVLAGGAALVALSLYRILAVTAWRPNGGTLDLSFAGISDTIQVYLSGPSNIAKGIEAIRRFPSSFQTFYSDFLIWTGYLGNFISETFNVTFLSTSKLFNQYLYGTSLIGSGDQIVPMCVQSIWYFGYIGSMIFSSIFAYFIVHFDYLICKSKSLPNIYINTMMAVVTGLMLGYNVTIISMYFMDRYLIFWVIIKLSDMCSNRIRIKMRAYRG